MSFHGPGVDADSGEGLSFVSFDVEGAYNVVDKNVLVQRLRSRQVPGLLVKLD
jgi:hypothetical protein